MLTTYTPLSPSAKREILTIKLIHSSILISWSIPSVIIGFLILFVAFMESGALHYGVGVKLFLGALIVAWLILFFINRQKQKKKIKKVYQDNTADYALAQQVQLCVNDLLRQATSGELTIPKINSQTKWRPFRLETFPNWEGNGSFSGFGGGIFSSSISGSISLKITPDLLKKSTIVYCVDDDNRIIQIIIPTTEVIITELRRAVGKIRTAFTDAQGYLAGGSHTFVAINDLNEVLNQIAYRLNQTKLINILALAAENQQTETRCLLELIKINDDLAFLCAAEINGQQYTIQPTDVAKTIEKQLLPLLTA